LDITEVLKEIDILTATLYKSISFQRGDRPDLIGLRNAFIPQGILINTDPEPPLIMTIDEFIGNFRRVIDEGQVTEFYEAEISGQTQVFGKIAHRYSSYQAHFRHDDALPGARGLNSIQFILTSEGWKTASMTWFGENELFKLPERFL